MRTAPQEKTNSRERSTAPVRGRKQRRVPGGAGATAGDGERTPRLRYASDVAEGVKSWPYRPAARLLGAVVTMAKRLQFGRLDVYLLHVLIVLVTVIATVTALF